MRPSHQPQTSRIHTHSKLHHHHHHHHGHRHAASSPQSLVQLVPKRSHKSKDRSGRHRTPSPPGSSASQSAASSVESSKKSRYRTRCLITLGLLLPVVAAIIGVVAWAVSAEVIMLPGRDVTKVDASLLQDVNGQVPYLDDPQDLNYGHSVHSVNVKNGDQYYQGSYDQQQPQNPRIYNPNPDQQQPVQPPTNSEVNRFLNKIVASSKDSNGHSPSFVVIAPQPDPPRNNQGHPNHQEPNRYGEEPSGSGNQVPQGLPPPPPPNDHQEQNPVMAMHDLLMSQNGGIQNPPPPPPPPPQPQPTFHQPPPPPPQQSQERSHVIIPPPPPPPPHHHQQHNQQRFYPPPPPPPQQNQQMHHYPPLPPPPPPQGHQVNNQGYQDSNRWGTAESGSSGQWEQPAAGGANKGVTITIGGGQNGHGGGGASYGGHSASISPLGLMKSIFLPFLPKPKVNLNGRVVFGVVLEKGVGLGGNSKGSGGGIGIQTAPVASYGHGHH